MKNLISKIISFDGIVYEMTFEIYTACIFPTELNQKEYKELMFSASGFYGYNIFTNGRLKPYKS